MKKGVLLITIGYSPNIGGIETHFDDLTRALSKRDWKVWVLTYKPITTEVSAKTFEKKDNIVIYRIPWPKGLFYNLVKNPIAEFLYLVPGLFLVLPIFLVINGGNISVIHSHGLIAGFVSVIWGKIFGKRVITTTHSIYNFPKSGIYRNFAKWIFVSSDAVLTLSKQSKKEIESIGVSPQKVTEFTYWIDLEKFKAKSGRKSNSFTVLFVGRLVEEKGIKVLLESLKSMNKKIKVVIIGLGPMEPLVKNAAKKHPNLVYLGKVDNSELPKYYSESDLLVVPSIHEEGFGRVIIEALSCGLPVIGSKRGAIPEAMDGSVGELIDVNPKNLKQAIEYYYNNPTKLNTLSKNGRPFALKKYSEKNVETIIREYSI